MVDIDRFMAEKAPFRLARLYFRGRSKLTRLSRSLRFRRMPKGGWGQGWRILVFRYGHPGAMRQLHVLAPVRGEAFDWDVLRLHTRGEPWPRVAHQPGHLTGVLRWAGHHLGVTTDDYGTQRIPMDRLAPGAFRGGVDIDLVLIDVRDATLVADESDR